MTERTDDPGPERSNGPTRVFGLAGDDVVRQGVLQLVAREPDLLAVGEAADVEAAMDGIARAHPDVALVDQHLGPVRGIDACRRIRRRFPDVACVLMASLADERTMVEGALAGAALVVARELRGTAMIDGIRAVRDGARLVDSDAAHRAVGRLGESLSPEPAVALRRLLELMADGRSRPEIARDLGVSTPDVDGLMDRLLRKVGFEPADYPR